MQGREQLEKELEQLYKEVTNLILDMYKGTDKIESINMDCKLAIEGIVELNDKDLVKEIEQMKILIGTSIKNTAIGNEVSFRFFIEKHEKSSRVVVYIDKLPNAGREYIVNIPNKLDNIGFNNALFANSVELRYGINEKSTRTVVRIKRLSQLADGVLPWIAIQSTTEKFKIQVNGHYYLSSDFLKLFREENEKELEQLYKKLIPMIDNMYKEVKRGLYSTDIIRAIAEINKLSDSDLEEEIRQMKAIITLLDKSALTYTGNLDFRFYLLKPSGPVRTIMILEDFGSHCTEITIRIPNNIDRVQLSSKCLYEENVVEDFVPLVHLYVKSLKQLHMDKSIIEGSIEKDKLKIYIDNKLISKEEFRKLPNKLDS